MKMQDVMAPLEKGARRFGEFLSGHSAAQISIDSVKRAELDQILVDPIHPGKPPESPDVWGLALSGGGIRSATFSLGVLQSLARQGLLPCFHYLSTVSGGGYIGGFLQGLIHRHGFEEAFKRLQDEPSDCQPSEPCEGTAPPANRAVQHLRRYSNYLAPRKSIYSGDTLAILGTYVRNVVLIQLQLLSLLMALVMLPLLANWLFFSWLANSTGLLLIAAAVLGVTSTLLMAYVTSAAGRKAIGAGRDSDLRSKVLARFLPAAPPLAIAMLAGASMLAAVGLSTKYDFGGPLRLAVIGGLLYGGGWLTWFIFEWRKRSGARASAEAKADANQQASTGAASPAAQPMHGLRFLLSTVAAAVLAGAMLVLAYSLMQDLAAGMGGTWSVMILGPAVMILAVEFTSIVHLGLAGPVFHDLQREVLARVGGKTSAAVLLGMSAALALSLLGPQLLVRLAELTLEQGSSVGWATALGWVGSTIAGLVAAQGAGVGSGQGAMGRLRSVVAEVAPWVFLLGLLMLVGLLGHWLLSLVVPQQFPVRPAEGQSAWPLYFKWLDAAAGTNALMVSLLVASALVLWLLLAKLVDGNEFSMNAFYRNRLVRCYLGASNDQRQPEPTTNFDDNDDLVLADVVAGPRLRGYRPLYPLIGSALNMVATRHLDWQDRKAASFVFSPGFCGYLPPDPGKGSVQVGDRLADPRGTPPGQETISRSTRLGSAMAISGAAVSPNMGHHSSPAVTFLLALFDVRLGWWLANPSHRTRPSTRGTPFFGSWLIKEMLGMTRDSGSHVYLSDGGHFENLGVYELARRRCRFILCVDAAADPGRGFSDLGNAVQKCRVDFGICIDIDVSRLRAGEGGVSGSSFAVGTIRYPDRSTGVLLYLKPSLTGQESPDVHNYASRNPSFPHQSTADQFFDETQFECYRALGSQVADDALLPALARARAEPGSDRHQRLGVHDSDVKEELISALRQLGGGRDPAAAANYSRHAATLSRMIASLRDKPDLAVLDAQLFPAWRDFATREAAAPDSSPARPSDSLPALPAPADFRVCFYFSQDLIRMMESIYHDLSLETAWDHPDNRGWMNLFRHWGWLPTVRVAWMVSAPSLAARFISFCELRLGFPSLLRAGERDRAIKVVQPPRAVGSDWTGHCDELLAQGALNFVEHRLLLAQPLLDGLDQGAARVYLMRLRWDKVLGRGEDSLPPSTFGVAVVDRGRLRMFRVQDHLRGIGLGNEFMRLLRSVSQIDEVDVRPGDYAQAGICRGRDAGALKAQLKRMLANSERFMRARTEADRRLEMELATGQRIRS